MDDLLREFLAETGEHLDTVDVELIRLERHPGDAAILRNIFRLVHTIKGTCGFLGLPRLEALAHAAETLMGQLRQGAPVTSETITLILATIDRIKLIMSELERIRAEPVGSDADLIYGLEQASLASSAVRTLPAESRWEPDEPDQVLLRPLRTGEVPLHVLEAAFRQTPGPDENRTAPSSGSAGLAGAPAGPRSGPDGEALPASLTVRVAVDTLESLMTTASELVLTRNQLLDAARRTKADGALKAPLQRLSQVTAELQDGVLKTRMQPIGSAWSKLPRLLRDLSAELGKEIELATRGADTELDRQLLETIRDPLTHLVRNAAAHGIESPAERLARGKPVQGTVALNAYQEGGAIAIEVADDGRGLDREAIRARAVEIGLVPPGDAARMTDAQVAELIFHPGLSTTAVADSVSGRGVGMDVVKTNVEAIGGTIEIASEHGRGASFRIKLPLTLAIVPALILRTSDQRFALPQAAITELIRVRPGSEHALERIDDALLLRLRGGLLPVIDLGSVLGLASSSTEEDVGYVVVTEVGRVQLGILVDAVIETEEIVVKPMCRRLKGLGPFSGNTILGDGTVALILDPNGLAKSAGADLMRTGSRPGARTAPETRGDSLPLLVFRGGDKVLKAMPLSLVTRLEELDAGTIERVGGRPHVQYRGRLMPLLPIDAATDIRRDGLQAVVVVSTGDILLGLAVSEVVNVVDERIEIQRAPGRPDLVGTAIVGGRATEILDIADYVPRAGEGWHGHGAATASTVLLVESNAFFRDMLTPVLRAAGHFVRTATSAEEALETLALGGIGAAVIDLDLPDRPGLELLAALRGNPDTQALPLVVLASRTDDEASRRAKQLCGGRVVAKFDRAGLLASLPGIADAPAREIAA